jgi:hypothetical protein
MERTAKSLGILIVNSVGCAIICCSVAQAIVSRHMDLTDVTIPPMILVGVGVVSVIIKTHTGWSWVASIGAGIVPGAVFGFLVCLLLFWTVYGICWTFLRLFRHRPQKPPD